MNEAEASRELLRLRKESEDWAVPEFPITDEATRGADDPDDLDMHVWKRDAEYRHFVTSDPDSLWEALECSCDRVLALLERQAKLEALAKELAEFAIDAAYQGAGQQPLSGPSWHSFISTWETADDLFRRADFRELLSADLRSWLDAALTRDAVDNSRLEDQSR